MTSETRVECHIGIDPGDWSVGIPEHWDEETMVTVLTDTDDGQWIIGAIFEPQDDGDVDDWPVKQAWSAFESSKDERRRITSVVDVDDPKTWRLGQVRPVEQQVRDLPAPMRAAVAAEWERFRAEIERQIADEEAMFRDFEEDRRD